MGVLNRKEYQIVFLDTPGIHNPKTRLGEYMMRSVHDAMDGMDCVLVILDVSHITDNDVNIAFDLQASKEALKQLKALIESETGKEAKL